MTIEELDKKLKDDMRKLDNKSSDRNAKLLLSGVVVEDPRRSFIELRPCSIIFAKSKLVRK